MLHNTVKCTELKSVCCIIALGETLSSGINLRRVIAYKAPSKYTLADLEPLIITDAATLSHDLSSQSLQLQRSFTGMCLEARIIKLVPPPQQVGKLSTASVKNDDHFSSA